MAGVRPVGRVCHGRGQVAEMSDRRNSGKWDRREGVQLSEGRVVGPGIRPERRQDAEMRERVEEMLAGDRCPCPVVRCACWLTGLRAMYRELRKERQ